MSELFIIRYNYVLFSFLKCFFLRSKCDSEGTLFKTDVNQTEKNTLYTTVDKGKKKRLKCHPKSLNKGNWTSSWFTSHLTGFFGSKLVVVEYSLISRGTVHTWKVVTVT